MPSRAWVVTAQWNQQQQLQEVSMPSRAWVVTRGRKQVPYIIIGFNALTGLSCYLDLDQVMKQLNVSMPSRAWVVTRLFYGNFYISKCFNALTGLSCYKCRCIVNILSTAFQCPHGLELLLILLLWHTFWIVFQCPHGLELLQEATWCHFQTFRFQCPHGLELLRRHSAPHRWCRHVSMPSRAWVVTFCPSVCPKASRVSMPSRAWVVTFSSDSWYWSGVCFNALTGLSCYVSPVVLFVILNGFNALTGLSCYTDISYDSPRRRVSMPSRAWVVTSWCIPFLVTEMFQCPHGLELLQW